LSFGKKAAIYFSSMDRVNKIQNAVMGASMGLRYGLPGAVAGAVAGYATGNTVMNFLEKYPWMINLMMMAPKAARTTVGMSMLFGNAIGESIVELAKPENQAALRYTLTGYPQEGPNLIELSQNFWKAIEAADQSYRTALFLNPQVAFGDLREDIKIWGGPTKPLEDWTIPRSKVGVGGLIDVYNALPDVPAPMIKDIWMDL